MPSDYYKKCKELDICNKLIEDYYLKGKYEECFTEHLKLAMQGYPLAECQVGYFYMEGLGVKKDLNKAFEWTLKGANHNDRDSQCNMGFFYENGIGTIKDIDKAKEWYKKAAMQNHDLAIKKCKEYQVEL